MSDTVTKFSQDLIQLLGILKGEGVQNFSCNQFGAIFNVNISFPQVYTTTYSPAVLPPEAAPAPLPNTMATKPYRRTCNCGHDISSHTADGFCLLDCPTHRCMPDNVMVEVEKAMKDGTPV